MPPRDSASLGCRYAALADSRRSIIEDLLDFAIRSQSPRRRLPRSLVGFAVGCHVTPHRQARGSDARIVRKPLLQRACPDLERRIRCLLRTHRATPQHGRAIAARLAPQSQRAPRAAVRSPPPGSIGRPLVSRHPGYVWIGANNRSRSRLANASIFSPTCRRSEQSCFMRTSRETVRRLGQSFGRCQRYVKALVAQQRLRSRLVAEGSARHRRVRATRPTTLPNRARDLYQPESRRCESAADDRRRARAAALRGGSGCQDQEEAEVSSGGEVYRARVVARNAVEREIGSGPRRRKNSPRRLKDAPGASAFAFLGSIITVLDGRPDWR
jgi:hypothetical protein